MDDQQDPFEARQAWLDRLDAAAETADRRRAARGASSAAGTATASADPR